MSKLDGRQKKEVLEPACAEPVRVAHYRPALLNPHRERADDHRLRRGGQLLVDRGLDVRADGVEVAIGVNRRSDRVLWLRGGAAGHRNTFGAIANHWLEVFHVDDDIAARTERRRGLLVGQNRRGPVMGTQTQRHRGEVRVRRQDHELVEPRAVLDGVGDVSADKIGRCSDRVLRLIHSPLLLS